MANAQILEIPVDSSEFDKFVKAFEDYQKKVEEMPAAWQQLNKTVSDFSRTQSGAANATAKVWNEAAKGTSDFQKQLRGVEKAQNSISRGAVATGGAMEKMVGSTKKVASHLAGAAKSIAKFAAFGVVGGLIGAGGLTFGLDRLAESTMNMRRSARGQGLTIGQYNAFRTNMAPYVGAGALRAAAEAQIDPRRYGSLAMLGISPEQAQRENAAQITGQEILAVHRAWRSNPSMLTAQAQGALAMGFSPEDIRNIGSTRGSTLRAAIEESGRDAGALNLSNPVSREWTQFSVQLRKAGVLIETSLINTLAPLAPKMTELSAKLSDFISSLGKTGTVKTWIDDLGAGIKSFTNWIGSPNFKQDMSIISYDFHRFASALQYVFGSPSPSPTPAPGATSSSSSSSVTQSTTKHGGKNNPFNMFDSSQKLMSFPSERRGVVAAFHRMEWYPKEYHTATLRQMLDKWKGPKSGPGDMTRKQYVDFISSHAGVDPNAPVPFNDSKKMAAIMHWQSVAEGHPVDQKNIKSALDTAYERSTLRQMILDSGTTGYIPSKARIEQISKAARDHAAQQAMDVQKSYFHVATTPVATTPDYQYPISKLLDKINKQRASTQVGITIHNNTSAQVHTAVNAAVQ